MYRSSPPIVESPAVEKLQRSGRTPEGARRTEGTKLGDCSGRIRNQREKCDNVGPDPGYSCVLTIVPRIIDLPWDRHSDLRLSLKSDVRIIVYRRGLL